MKKTRCELEVTPDVANNLAVDGKPEQQAAATRLMTVIFNPLLSLGLHGFYRKSVLFEGSFCHKCTRTKADVKEINLFFVFFLYASMANIISTFSFFFVNDLPVKNRVNRLGRHNFLRLDV